MCAFGTGNQGRLRETRGAFLESEAGGPRQRQRRTCFESQRDRSFSPGGTIYSQLRVEPEGRNPGIPGLLDALVIRCSWLLVAFSHMAKCEKSFLE